ncbi:conserved hypothetical protein [Tenacibaculum xiamenense]
MVTDILLIHKMFDKPKIKLLLITVISGTLFYWIKNSSKIELWQSKLDNSNIPDGFGLFVTVNIIKYFLLLVSLMSLVLLLIKLFKK